MPRALALSAGRDAVGRAGSRLSPSVDDGGKVNPTPSRTSAEIVRLAVVPLPKLREDIKRKVANLFWATFEGSSLNAKCDDAAWKVAGVSAATFARIASRETDKIDLALVQVMLALHYAKHGFVPEGLAIRTGGAA